MASLHLLEKSLPPEPSPGTLPPSPTHFPLSWGGGSRGLGANLVPFSLALASSPLPSLPSSSRGVAPGLVLP